jgi:hypothetical protein
MFFGDTEIYRTSTAEPTRTGIIWSYVKDMSAFVSLFKTPQKIIFDLGNLVDDTYTGVWNTTLIVTFFTAEDTFKPADLIIPISARKSTVSEPSSFIVPETNATSTLLLPRNAEKVVFSISACGQAAEEFWWSNVLSSDTQTFGNESTLYGHSPFRELQLYIDGYLAGVAWPFPVIFTGGIIPGFWRPIVGIDAFDLREDEINISPFIPLLSDGTAHTFSIRVVGIDDDGNGNGHFTEAIESNWVVTGKLFVWSGAVSGNRTGSIPIIRAPEPSILLQSSKRLGLNGTVDSLDYAVEVSRQLHIESILDTATGSTVMVWSQNLTYSNAGTISNQGNDQVIRQSTAGSHNSLPSFLRVFQYPLLVSSSYNVQPGGNITITGNIGRGKYVQQLGDLAFPNDWKTFDSTRLPSTMQNLSFLGSQTHNWQNGTASYLSVPAQKKSYSAGSTDQLFTLSGISDRSATVVQDGTNGASSGEQAFEELYRRHIIAANDSVMYDDEAFGGQVMGQSRFTVPTHWTPGNEMQEYAGQGVRAFLGRGPL